MSSGPKRIQQLEDRQRMLRTMSLGIATGLAFVVVVGAAVWIGGLAGYCVVAGLFLASPFVLWGWTSYRLCRARAAGVEVIEVGRG